MNPRRLIGRLVGRVGTLKVIAWALRSRHPVPNLLAVRRNALFASVMTRTLCSYDRLANTYELALAVEREGTEGAFVECGVWRGGVAGLLAIVARRSGKGRHVHLFDSFQGCPAPTAEDGLRARGLRTREHGEEPDPIGLYVASEKDVSDFLLNKLRVPRDGITLHRGWFQDTLPSARGSIGRIALLRIDADWYESVKGCLEQLYDNVSMGGYVILDDYGMYPGCRRAFEEVSGERDLQVELRDVDGCGVWFQKNQE